MPLEQQSVKNLPLEREETQAGGRYVIRLPDGSEAELTYRRRSPDTVVADHTFVPQSFRGHGIAERLVLRLIEDARHQAFRIVPLCSYVAAMFQRNQDWADLRA